MKDEARKRTGSGGTTIRVGTGHTMPVCQRCGDRMRERYGLKGESA